MPRPPNRPRVAAPIGPSDLEALALRYVGRFATTRARLAAYLVRKLRERGWAGDGEPAIEAVVTRIAALGYVDDGEYARAKSAGMTARGYGERRVADALRHAGIETEDAAAARDAARESAWDSALRFAQRRRIGPFGAAVADPDARRRALGAMIRAGHDGAIARRLVAAAPGEVPDRDG